MTNPPDNPRSVLVTGAAGYIGRQLVAELAHERRGIERITAADIHLPADCERLEGVDYVELDVRDSSLARVLREHTVDTVAHLAAIVTPGTGDTAELEYSVDVLGTRNVLESCLESGVEHFVYTSSGAAYGYWPDNPTPLRESDALRGNDTFPYARNKRLVEEMLAMYRREHAELRQLVFRPGTILGATVSNQITAMFERPIVVGLRETDTPFVFIWDRDVVCCLAIGIRERREGTYTLAGDGAVTLRDIAHRLNKSYVPLPAAVLRAGLSALRPLRIAPYGPEQVEFLRYRPVLCNDKLKTEFGYRPLKTSAEAFAFYSETHGSAA
jgi:UDP-glucose 4-epimerase